MPPGYRADGSESVEDAAVKDAVLAFIAANHGMATTRQLVEALAVRKEDLERVLARMRSVDRLLKYEVVDAGLLWRRSDTAIRTATSARRAVRRLLS
jgi:hypothetical protein